MPPDRLMAAFKIIWVVSCDSDMNNHSLSYQTLTALGTHENPCEPLAADCSRQIIVLSNNRISTDWAVVVAVVANGTGCRMRRTRFNTALTDKSISNG